MRAWTPATVNERVLALARAWSEKRVRPWCRSYAKHVLRDRPADAVYELLCAFVFWEVHRYWPRFRNPRTFSEKLWHRCLYDRDAIWTLFSDKLRSRDYIAERVGRDHLVPLLWTGADPDAIPFDDLPPRIVIKTNHGCGYNIILDGEGAVDRDAVRQQLRGWLAQNYCEAQMVGMEWGYKNVSPAILIEAFLGSRATPPIDYKFFCYDGRARFIQVNQGRYRDHRFSFFDREFNRLPMRVSARFSSEGTFARPDDLSELLRIAETLAAGLPFIRVDLYSIDGRIYAGELTCYPGGGVLRFEPRAFDDAFGEPWIMGGSRRDAPRRAG
jgi:hypothetical protein